MMVWNGYYKSVEVVCFFIEHFTEILIQFCRWVILRKYTTGLSFIDIAKGINIFAAATPNIVAALTTNTNTGDISSITWSLLP